MNKKQKEEKKSTELKKVKCEGCKKPIESILNRNYFFSKKKCSCPYCRGCGEGIKTGPYCTKCYKKIIDSRWA